MLHPTERLSRAFGFYILTTRWRWFRHTRSFESFPETVRGKPQCFMRLHLLISTSKGLPSGVRALKGVGDQTTVSRAPFCVIIPRMMTAPPCGHEMMTQKGAQETRSVCLQPTGSRGCGWIQIQLLPPYIYLNLPISNP